MNPLEARIQYKFRNSLLLAEALTHPSLGHETQRYHFDNQRLEFLGDAVLQLIFTEHLFKLFPGYSEGQLTKLRSRLVSREGLKVHAINIGLGNYLMMGKGEETSGGRARSSALADAFEALIGAMYLDSDLATVRKFVLREAKLDIENLQFDTLDVNPKGKLQEILQAHIPAKPSIHDHFGIRPGTPQGFCLGSQLVKGSNLDRRRPEQKGSGKIAAEKALTQKIWIKKESQKSLTE